MQPEMVNFNEREVTQKKVYNWILANLPDYSTVIDSKEKLDSFFAEDDKDINKVILFSKKNKVPPILKVLTNTYRDKLRFGFI